MNKVLKKPLAFFLRKHLSLLFQRVADRLYGVYKVHGNYGRVFRCELLAEQTLFCHCGGKIEKEMCFHPYSEWSAIEREMGDGLQSAGHHMDT